MRNSKKLYRDIREQGYANGEEVCARYTAQFRRTEARGMPRSSTRCNLVRYTATDRINLG